MPTSSVDARLFRHGDSIRWGQTADPAGAFLSYPLAFERVATDGLPIESQSAPQDELDQLAAREALDVTPLSPAAWARLADRYVLLAHGTRMRRRGGPWLVAREPIVPEALTGGTIAIAGEWTSGAIALRGFLPEADLRPMAEDELLVSVVDGQVEAAVVAPHLLAGPLAARVHRIVDLAQWWSGENGDAPLPICLPAARRALGADRLRRVAAVARRVFAECRNRREAALGYAAERYRGLRSGRLAELIDGEMDANDAPIMTHGLRPILQVFLAKCAAGLPDGVEPTFLE
jgi:predicted solute-binding protein